VRIIVALLLPLLSAATPALGQEGDWRRVATPADRERLRGWRDAWVAALAAGAGAGVAGDPLFAPDRSIDGPMPPPGGLRCRLSRLGGGRGGGRADAVPVACAMTGDGAVRRLIVSDGVQRLDGELYAHTAARAMFLGTVMLADEARPIRYGRDARRDAAGLVERVGAARWRLVLPYPRMGGVLDVVEIVPAGEADVEGAAGTD